MRPVTVGKGILPTTCRKSPLQKPLQKPTAKGRHNALAPLMPQSKPAFAKPAAGQGVASLMPLFAVSPTKKIYKAIAAFIAPIKALLAIKLIKRQKIFCHLIV